MPSMTQKQLDVASLDDFTAVQWESNQVTCQLHERFSPIVKRYKHDIYILLRSGSKVIKLPCDIATKMASFSPSALVRVKNTL